MAYAMSNEGTKIPKAFHVKKGALHTALGIKQGKKIAMSTLQKAKRSSDPLMKKRAQFAINARSFKKGK